MRRSGTPPLRAAVPYLPSRDFDTGLAFYRRVGFAVDRVDDRLALLELDGVRAYLQDAWNPAWADSLIVQFRVDDAVAWERHLAGIALEFPEAQLTPAQRYPWGATEVHLRDPSGVALRFSEGGG